MMVLQMSKFNFSILLIFPQLVFLSLVFLFCGSPAMAPALAAPPSADPTTGYRKSQFGAISIEQEEAKRDPYKVVEEGAINYFSDVSGRVKQLAKGEGISAIALPSDEILRHMTGVYLYCSVKTGACPLVLEAMLEVDVINARINKNGSCPLLTKFWKQWVGSGMEQRQDYLVETGLLETIEKFKSDSRPKYIRCQETIKQETSGTSDQALYFKDRYRAGSRPGIVAEKTLEFLKKLQEKKINVFVATGAASPGGDAAGNPPQGGGAVRRSR
jgi:hypothetical protein